jgi:hypothetical protein
VAAENKGRLAEAAEVVPVKVSDGIKKANQSKSLLTCRYLSKVTNSGYG